MLILGVILNERYLRRFLCTFDSGKASSVFLSEFCVSITNLEMNRSARTLLFFPSHIQAFTVKFTPLQHVQA